MAMKKFLIKISYTVLPVWLLLVGLATYLWWTNDNAGDLMRLGLIESDSEYADSIRAVALHEKVYHGIEHEDALRSTTCDVLVIGDSFSHGGGVGKQGDYVNYLAHDGQLNVVVFTSHDASLDSPIQLAYDVMNLGCIDSSRVKNLVVEEVERYIPGRHGGFVTTHQGMPISHIESKPAEQTGGDGPALKKADTGPLMRVKDYIFYHFLGANPIYKAGLSSDLFGGKEPRMLYFYNEDVKNGVEVPDEMLTRIGANYRQLIDKAREKGINLVIVIACDKYDLYQDFIVDNPYPAKRLNEAIVQTMGQDTVSFVFTKGVLHPLVERGVKDVYLFNDTHWSPSSSRIVAREVINKLK